MSKWNFALIGAGDVPTGRYTDWVCWVISMVSASRQQVTPVLKKDIGEVTQTSNFIKNVTSSV